MIHNNSTHPVLIKKISLKIWTLRDEIEARIQEQVDQGIEPEKINLKDLKHEYNGKNKNGNNVVAINSNVSLVAQAETDNADKSSEGDENNNVVDINTIASDPNMISIRIDAPPIPEEKIAIGKTMLAEIGMEKMFFFTNRSFSEGQTIVIQFCIPKTFILNADVLYCRPFSLKTKIISQNNLTHRTMIRFNFLREGERALLRQFLTSIEPDLSKYAQADENKKTEGTGKGELDDLGL